MRTGDIRAMRHKGPWTPFVLLFLAVFSTPAALGEDRTAQLSSETHAGYAFFLHDSDDGQGDNLNVKSASANAKIQAYDAKIIYGGDECRIEKTTERDVEILAATAIGRSGPCAFKITGSYYWQRTGGSIGYKGVASKLAWKARFGGYRLYVAYTGGDDHSDATSEVGTHMIGPYFLKGYLLRIWVTGADTSKEITWSIKNGDTEKGQYYIYDDTEPVWALYSSPKTRNQINAGSQGTYYDEIGWRSDWDQNGSIQDEYTITVIYTPVDSTEGVMLDRRIESRLLDPGNPDHRDYFNEDVDMLQRAMIQILFLDKGRLTKYRIGKYEQNDRGFYSRAAGKKPWSAVADEVWNVDKFVVLTPDPSYKLNLRQVTAIWDQYDRIVTAGQITTAINQTTPSVPQYLTYRTTAVNQSGLDIAAPYSETGLLDAVCKQEGTSTGVATHCYAIAGSLYWNSVKIGEKNSAQGGVHTHTDGGLGWGSVQPYNAGTRNLYHPQQNMTRVAEMIASYHNTAAASPDVPGKKSRIWHAVYGYHHGSMWTAKTPGWLTENAPEPAGYANNVFNRWGIAAPTTNNED